MSFAWPWAFVGLLALPALVAIYWLRQRSRRLVVSSLMLWRDQLPSRASGRRRERFEGSRLNDIARVAGVSIGSVYEYFPGKEAVVTAMVRELIESYFKKLKSEITSKHNNNYETAMRHWIGLLFK
ncbi:MAG: BatA domain-containing protein [Acidobacteriota bacterium]